MNVLASLLPTAGLRFEPGFQLGSWSLGFGPVGDWVGEFDGAGSGGEDIDE